ncbi:MAG TPA: S9 family peptidase, partial [Caulobacteraceae bacterium]
MKLAIPVLALAMIAPLLAKAQTPPADPYIWLEEASSPRAMAWVEAHNKSVAPLEADARYKGFYDIALALAAAKDRIPAPHFLHGDIYNFWQDADHLRGYWRKTSLADYRAAAPTWTTVLDIDALGKAEGKSWVFKGLDCLQPRERLCLVSLSDGGEDAVEIREFDLDTGAFVANGFHLPHGKHRAAWEDANHLLVASEWTPGEATASGYPFVVKRLTRGQPLSAAVEVYRGDKADGGYGVSPAVLFDGQDRKLAFIQRPLDTFRSQTFILTPKGAERLAMPGKANIEDLVDGRVIVRVDEDWTVDGHAIAAGSLVGLDLAATLADPAHPHPKLIWAPTARESLGEVSATRDRLIVTILDNVRGRALALTPTAEGGWTSRPLPLADNLTVGIADADRHSDRAFI